MPQSKTGAGPELNGAFFTSYLKIDWTGTYVGPGQILSQNNPRPGQDRSYTGHFSPLKDIKITQDLGQNLVLNLDWIGANFSTRKTPNWGKLNTQNRLDRPTTDQLAQNNPRPRQK